MPAMELGSPGPERDGLVASVLRGEKTATTSLAVQYEDDNEVIPGRGACALVDSEGRAVAIVEVVDVEVIRLGDADLELARDEGEGFRSVSQWRKAHERFWTEQIRPTLRDPAALRLDDDTRLVVERFRVVGPVEPARG
jgi:uncharacterized protein YhfF